MRCPACDAPGELFLSADSAQVARFLEYSRIKYCGLLDNWLDVAPLRVQRCRHCGHHWYETAPPDEMLSAMYAAGRPLVETGSPSRAASGPMLREMRRLRRIVAAKTSPSLLDYGSGFGRWARAARDAGFRVTAYEPSRSRGEESAPPFVVVHDTQELPGGFDVVNVEQVLEHVRDPLQTLRDLGRVCAPDALVRITVPNLLRAPEGERLWIEWPFNGRRPHTLAPFEHLHGFTPTSLRKLIARAGFVELAPASLAATHGLAMMRRIASRVWPRMGQTLVLARPAHR